MPIECELIPKLGLDPEPLKVLGNALVRWFVRERGPDGLAHSLDMESLVDLLNGRLPRLRRRVVAPSASSAEWPAVRPAHVVNYEIPIPSLHRLQTVMARLSTMADPVVGFRVRRGRYDRKRVIATLREFVPLELVQDIRIEGRTWLDH